jgi:hypothetical protein
MVASLLTNRLRFGAAHGARSPGWAAVDTHRRHLGCTSFSARPL